MSHPNLEISTVVGCKLRCTYCPQTLHIKKYAETNEADAFKMTLETFQRCLATVPARVEIMFAGMAEPWLNENATDMVLHAHDKGHRVAVYTTSVGFTARDAERLRSSVPFLQFCLHLPDAGGLMKLKVDEAYLAGLRAAMTIPGHHFMAIGPLHPEVREIIGRDINDDSHGVLSRAGNLPGRAIPRKTGPLRCSATAPGVLDHNVLLPNGDVVLCCCDYNIEHVFGNLLQVSYPALFEGDEYRRVMRGLESDESIEIACRRCELSVPV